MSNPFIGEVKLVPYNFAPRGWAECAGQLLPIAQNEALFALIGTTYGGDGQSTFALPDLRGRAAISMGQGPGLSIYAQGEQGGAENVTLSAGQMPSHSHQTRASSSIGNQASPNGQHVAHSSFGLGYVYDGNADGAMPASSVSATGGNQPHNNHQPYLVLTYVIALEGVFPPRS